MKKFILLTIILISNFSYSQKNNDSYSEKEKFSYNNKGLEPKDLIVSVNGMKSDAMLKKAKEWVKEKYGDSEEKIEEIKNDDAEKGKKSKKINLKGFSENTICFNEGTNYNCERADYTIMLQFEDGEYKFKPKKLSYKPASSKKKINIHFNKSDLHTAEGKINNNFAKVPAQIETLLNNLNKSLLNYLTNKPQEDEW